MWAYIVVGLKHHHCNIKKLNEKLVDKKKDFMFSNAVISPQSGLFLNKRRSSKKER